MWAIIAHMVCFMERVQFRTVQFFSFLLTKSRGFAKINGYKTLKRDSKLWHLAQRESYWWKAFPEKLLNLPWSHCMKVQRRPAIRALKVNRTITVRLIRVVPPKLTRESFGPLPGIRGLLFYL